MTVYSDNLRDQFGRAIQGAQVGIFTSTGGAAAPAVLTGELGEFSFDVPGGIYRVEYYIDGVLRRVDESIVIGEFGPSGTADFAAYHPSTATNFAAATNLAYADVVNHWWSASASRFYGSQGGIAFDNRRPFLWQLEQLLTNVYWRWKRTGGSDPLAKLTGTYAATVTDYGANLSAAVLANDVGASDDVAWNCFLMCEANDVTGSATWLTRTSALIASARTRFADPTNSGFGLLYADTDLGPSIREKASTSYESLIASAALYCVSKGVDVATNRAYARATAAWMKAKLKSPSRGHYWDEVTLDPSSAEYRQVHLDQFTDATAPVGRGFSYARILGNCGIAVLNARLYRDALATGETALAALYLGEAKGILAAMLRQDTFLRPGNVFISSSDPWTDGHQFPYVVAEVLSLPGADPEGLFAQTIADTGAAVARNRTTIFNKRNLRNYGDGFYGPDWSGAEVGLFGDLLWQESGRYPEEIQTTGTSLCLVTAAWMTGLGQAYSDVATLSNVRDAVAQALVSRARVDGPFHTGDMLITGDIYSGKGFHTNNDGQAFFGVDGSGNPILNGDNSCFIRYNRTAHRWEVNTAGGPGSYIDAGGGYIGGALTVTGDMSAGYVKAGPNFYMTLSGNDRFLNWHNNCYDRFNIVTNKRSIYINGVCVVSIDASGNVVSKGTITPSGTPTG